MNKIVLTKIVVRVFALLASVVAVADQNHPRVEFGGIGEIEAVRTQHRVPGGELFHVADHHRFNTDELVNGATILVRDLRHHQVNAYVSSKALAPDTAYSIWWAIFNRPRFCATPNDCKITDLEAFGGDPRVRASVFWGGGFVSDAYGTVNTSLRLRPGRTKRELAVGTRDYGLRNLAGAEIHLVFRTHGTAGAAGPLSLQVGTENEACPEDGCRNVFASIHPGLTRR